MQAKRKVKRKYSQYENPVHEDHEKRLNENNRQKLGGSVLHAMLLYDQILELAAIA